MGFVKLSSMPDPKKQYTLSFNTLHGGLNIKELDYRLGAEESPKLRNLMWRDGVLCSRDGQRELIGNQTLVGYACYERLFHGAVFAHLGTRLRWADPAAETPEWHEIMTGLPQSRGTFFHYNDKLYYKAQGVYIAISYANSAFTAAPVTAYTPVIAINSDPEVAGSGDIYQPENRISAGKEVWFNAKSGVSLYHLPATGLNSVDSVTVDGAVKTAGTDYTVNLTQGTVSFATAPPVTDPATNNTVRIRYSKTNSAAMNSIMDCRYAVSFGGTGELCIVMGGSTAQPNAYFWNGGTSTGMDAGYFPMEQYQLAGDTDDPVTGFGKQQSYLVIFKERSVGRTVLNTTEVNERTVIDLPYTPINAKIGCDLPWTIKLVDNNLVWCNTEQGVHYLKDSSYAYENNIVCLSEKVNGDLSTPGLLEDVRSGKPVCAADDERRYWLCANGHVWVWQYEISDYTDPSWFYWTGIDAVATLTELETVYHIGSYSRLTVMNRSFSDYGRGIDKVYRFATQNFGDYSCLKNIESVIIVVRSDTSSESELTYITDYETRTDLTPITAKAYGLSYRNLAFRALVGSRFAQAFRRRPMCRRVRHFTMELTNSVAGEDLSIVSAQVTYTLQGRQR